MAAIYVEAYPLPDFQAESAKMLPSGGTDGKDDFRVDVDRLPDPDAALSTKRNCLIALYFSYTLGVAALVTSVALLLTKGGVVTTGLAGSVLDGVSNIEVAGEVIPLAFNVLIAACTEAISYIHSVSLRWALYREGRLEFNSNLRLFTSASSSPANTRIANFASASALVVCYTAASQTIVQGGDGLLLNGVALLMLGIGLLVLCGIASMCLRDSNNRILSWSPNPLNTTLACLQHGIVRHRPGRGMQPVQETHLPAQPTPPRHRQPALRTAFRAIRYIVWAQYLLTMLVTALAVLLFILIQTLNRVPTYSFLFNENASTGFNVGGASAGYATWLFCTFLFAAALQTFFVLATHGAELLVNIARDEAAWRAAASGTRNGPGPGSHGARLSSGALGARLSSGALGAAAQSALWLVLLVFKPVAGWLFTSQGVRFVLRTQDSSIAFNPMPLFALAGMALFLAGLEEWLLRRRVAGPQPVAYGHLQTLADLVDEWPAIDGLGMGKPSAGRLYWGAKGADERGKMRVGTSGRKDGVGPVDFAVLYQ